MPLPIKHGDFTKLRPMLGGKSLWVDSKGNRFVLQDRTAIADLDSLKRTKAVSTPGIAPGALSKVMNKVINYQGYKTAVPSEEWRKKKPDTTPRG